MQSCRVDICFFIGEKPSRKHFDENNNNIDVAHFAKACV